MGKSTEIGWTDATVNFWHGCIKVSEGCKYCYMYRDKDRYGQDPTMIMRSGKDTFNAPLRWKDPKLIFVCSWSDFFIEQADEWREDAWKIIKDTPHHTYQILTKRPERIMQCLPKDWGEKGYPNVWIGFSAEDQSNLARRWFYFTEFPARVKFISAEPLLGDLNLQVSHYDINTMKSREEAIKLTDVFNWVIIGGESGNDNGKWRYRPAQIAWYKNIIYQCKFHGIPVFVKQLGTYLAKTYQLSHRSGADMEEWDNANKSTNVGTNISNETMFVSLKTQEYPQYITEKTNI